MLKPKSAKIIVRLINFLTSFDLYNDGDAGAVNQKNLYRQIYLNKLVFLKKDHFINVTISLVTIIGTWC